MLEIKDPNKELIIEPKNVEVYATSPHVLVLHAVLDELKAAMPDARKFECAEKRETGEYSFLYEENGEETETSRSKKTSVRQWSGEVKFVNNEPMYSFDGQSFWKLSETQHLLKVRASVMQLLVQLGFKKLEVKWLR
jgi:hypothetical protein